MHDSFPDDRRFICSFDSLPAGVRHAIAESGGRDSDRLTEVANSFDMSTGFTPEAKSEIGEIKDPPVPRINL